MRNDNLRFHYVDDIEEPIKIKGIDINESKLVEPLDTLTQPKKSDMLMKGLRAIKNKTFHPNWFGGASCFGGHLQTMQTVMRNRKISQQPYELDFEEDYTLEDGGQICLSFKGDFSEDATNPVVLFAMGGGGTPRGGDQRNCIDSFVAAGMSVAVIGYRGFGLDSKGNILKLKTPKIFSSYRTKDFSDPAWYIYDKFCKEKNRDVYGFAISMGGLVMSGAMPDMSFIKAAALCSTMIEPLMSDVEAAKAPRNFYNWHFGKKMLGNMEDNAEILAPEIKEKLDIDLISKLNELKTEGRNTIDVFDNTFMAPMAGYKDRIEYYNTVSPVEFLKKVEKPVLVLNHEDDPFTRMSFNKEPFRTNPNVALATTKTGGHMAAQESAFHYQLWVMDPVITFLLAAGEPDRLNTETESTEASPATNSDENENSVSNAGSINA